MLRTLPGTLALALCLALLACSSTDAPSATASDAGGAPPSTLPQTCTRGPRSTGGPAPAACNGAPALCDRTYDKVVVPMAHNAMSNADDGFGVPNQNHGLARQLADGVRGMMLDLHYYDAEQNLTDTGRLAGVSAQDQVYLCHGPCALGKTRLLDGLCALTAFVDQNPGEVLTIIFESYVSDADTDAVLRASGLADYAYAHALGTPWPTLRQLVDTGKRVVMFVEQSGGDPPYLMPAYKGEIWDTPYAFQTQADFTCALGRGIAGSPLYLINHWLGRPLSDIAYAREVNVAAVLGKRVSDCTREAGRGPTFVAVDFYDVGDLFSVVRQANGLP